MFTATAKIFVAATLFVALSSSAYAIDFSATINDIDGKPLPICAEKTPECEKPATLGRIASTALFADLPSERDSRTGASSISGDDKVKRAALAIDIVNGGNKDLKVEDIALIKRVIGMAYSPLIVKRSWDLLDPQK